MERGWGNCQYWHLNKHTRQWWPIVIVCEVGLQLDSRCTLIVTKYSQMELWTNQHNVRGPPPYIMARAHCKVMIHPWINFKVGEPKSWDGSTMLEMTLKVWIHALRVLRTAPWSPLRGRHRGSEWRWFPFGGENGGKKNLQVLIVFFSKI